MRNSNYFAQAKQEINESEFLNFGNDFVPQQGLLNAVGEETALASQPYVFTITNTTTTNLTDVEVLNSDVRESAYDASTGYANGCLITSNTTGITYQALLRQLQRSPISVGQTRFIGSTAAQALASFQIKTYDASGNFVGRSIRMSYDRYQQVNTITDSYVNYLVNGLTAMIISNIYASCTLQIEIYPALKKNDLNTLTGTGSTTAYSTPGLNPLVEARGVNLKMLGK